MKNMILILTISTIGLLGCTAIKQRSIADDLIDTSNLVLLVCESAALFESAGLEVPGADMCGSAMDVVGSNEYAIIYDAAKCVKKNNVKTEKFLECIDSVDGWKVLAEKLSKTTDD